MHDALIAMVAMLIGLVVGLVAGVVVTKWLTADRTGAVASLIEAGRRMTDYHEQVRSLMDLLRPPQARGKFGEQQLELILNTTLPPGCWKRQHTLRSGRCVDTVVQLPDAVVGVDAKFPMEAFDELCVAVDPTVRAKKRREFVAAVKRRVNEVAERYIAPGETLDFALCFLPAEGVLYELLREDRGGEDVFRYALDRRVFLVSPWTLYAYLSTVALGLRGLRVDAGARRIVDAVGTVEHRLELVNGHFGTLLRHVREAYTKAGEVAVDLEQLPGTLTQVIDATKSTGADVPVQRAAPVLLEDPPNGPDGS
jgi:DNA recombination protein RmuC